MLTIAVVGTLDSKGAEHEYLAQLIRKRGHSPLLIDTGTFGPPTVQPDITREEVAAAGGIDLKSAQATKDRGQCVTAIGAALPALLSKLVQEQKIHGVISLGGGGGTSISTTGMRALPIGFPKVMVSTFGSGNVAPYTGGKDIVMFPSLVDISGLNRVSKLILRRAAAALCGMVEDVAEIETEDLSSEDRPMIAASMFGNTTQSVDQARSLLEKAGFEVLVFHATGSGGKLMESMIESGLFQGVLDITTTEWADEWVGGNLGAGPTRLEAAAKAGIPAIIAPGCLDMVNFAEPSSIPSKFKDRLFYPHNPQNTLMRTSVEENRELGKIIAQKANLYGDKVTVIIPQKAISVISAEGGAFYQPEADAALFESIRTHLDPSIEIIELDCGINDEVFSAKAVESLLKRLSPA